MGFWTVMLWSCARSILATAYCKISSPRWPGSIWLPRPPGDIASRTWASSPRRSCSAAAPSVPARPCSWRTAWPRRRARPPRVSSRRCQCSPPHPRRALARRRLCSGTRWQGPMPGRGPRCRGCRCTWARTWRLRPRAPPMAVPGSLPAGAGGVAPCRLGSWSPYCSPSARTPWAGCSLSAGSVGSSPVSTTTTTCWSTSRPMRNLNGFSGRTTTSWCSLSRCARWALSF
mmetsp:Transcript_82838/g.215792  ORF Transcript_82838/g.215792 Transcript_82838/m.215792 type:complete len:230 (+) Transcript_82838:321-1010(+)